MVAEFNNDPRLRIQIGNVRDPDRLCRVFQGVDCVVHAASLKQVDRSAEQADEFHETICNGARNVIRAAHASGVKRVVALSTDKAVESVVAYGSFKSSAEHLFIGGNAWGSCKFALVRYGNILDSRGSVLETWRERAKAGKPLQVTDERMTRFWMDIWEAVDLVCLALDRMRGGEIFIPKGVQRTSIMDLLQVYHSGKPYRRTGKRGAEKIHECLVATEERDRLRDCGDVYVLLPADVKWEPGPYGTEGEPVPDDFEYRSSIQ
jgi:UDP-N-acetylglucosamine 4,6-dehydratase